ncbi:GHKL domain-containing protein [Prolixibacteraceae bacterium JC049]|nr:GHKL domain-containing protein [Prolixibacteraceae bacterium JC049]
MPSIKKYQNNKILGHITFWLTSIFLSLMLFYIYGDFRLKITWDILAKVFTYNIGFATAVYTNLYFLFPRFLKKRKYIQYFISLLVTLFVSALFIDLIFVYPLNFLFDPYGDFSSIKFSILFQFFLSSTGYVVFTSILKVVDEWIELQNVRIKLKETEKQRLNAELDTLKAQINPHFFFNSLNNIYSLALECSEKTPDLILKLSELMRHVLYDSQHDYIDINRELEFIQNYIDLQKIRYTNDEVIEFTHQVDSYKKVAPLIFQPFIENAFKHGAKNANENAFIRIDFQTQSDDLLIFSIINQKGSKDDLNTSHKGIGVENVKKRLKLLYLNEHELSITQSDTIYSVKLILKLK